jgi:hypothetical protein
MNRNWVTYFGIFLVLFFCRTPVQLKAGGYGEYREKSYQSSSGPAYNERVFDQMLERSDIKLAINTLVGRGFTSDEIQEAVQNRLQRIPRWHFPGDFCSAQGTIGEPGETIVVGPTYYLIVARAHILRYARELPGAY